MKTKCLLLQWVKMYINNLLKLLFKDNWGFFEMCFFCVKLSYCTTWMMIIKVRNLNKEWNSASFQQSIDQHTCFEHNNISICFDGMILICGLSRKKEINWINNRGKEIDDDKNEKEQALVNNNVDERRDQ